MIETRKEFDCILVDSHIDNDDGLTICENCGLELGEGWDCGNCQIDGLKRTVEGLRKVVIAAKQADKVLIPYLGWGLSSERNQLMSRCTTLLPN